MKFQYIIISFYILITYIYRIRRTTKSINFLTNGGDKDRVMNTFPIIHIIVPVFNEQKVIIDTLQCLLKMDYPKEKLSINIVGTVSEHTIDYLNKNFKNNCKFISLYISPKSGKSNQVNYAIDQISDKIKNPKNEYILVYDADSNPSKNSLLSFRSRILEFDFPIALQQSTIYLKNFDSLGWYGKIESIFQLSRVLVYEVYGQLKTINSATAYTYMVGHGMCIRIDFLLKTGKFSVPYDDVHMGQRVRLFGEKIIPVNTMDVSDTAISFREIIRQSGGWLLGGLIITEFQRIKHYNNIHDLQVFWPIIYIKGIFDTLSWFTDGILILLLMWYSFMDIKFLGLILLWELLSLISLWLVVNFAKKLGIKINRMIILLLIGGLLRPVVRMISLPSAFVVMCSGKIKRAKRGEN
ncbi:glycosyltransferase [Lactobacillus sp. DCY120]|uniref:Glycosyltransferase n=1 Tax=Bombilactobacillus apium TaxID=2675299 RepID=A0A850R220_9LACO|nr:glycosyltransferase [Bombilactobacillus apium]NVY97179.1 glycosyltransferase [Bombilactobacillus apium]